MRLYEAWQFEYEQRRYLRFASDEQIQDRMFDIINNCRTLTPKNKIGLLDADAGGSFWRSRMSHLMAEMRLRGCGLPPMPRKYAAELKGATNPIPEVEEWLSARGLQPGDYLIKFSARGWNEDALKLGKIRIASASSLDSSALLRAVRDREMQRITYSLPGDLRVIDPSGNPARPAGAIEVIQESTTDYFMYCVSIAHQRRLFHDFRSDSCLVIHNVNEFVDRLVRDVLRVHPEFVVEGKNVEYFDPFNTVGPLDVFFNKSFGYAYQQEFRIVWLPPNAEAKLEPFFVNIGSIEDIAELVC